jgi:branched-chain amino acid transport system substrate-binding protein
MNFGKNLGTLALAVLALGGSFIFAARADDQKPPIRIGVLTDISGHLADMSGMGTVEAVRMAVADVGGSVLGRPVEVVFADHQNKPDTGLAIARKWFDVDHVRLILDVNNSALALAVQSLTREKNQIVVFGGAFSTDLTGKACSPNGFSWITDTFVQTHALVDQYVAAGARTWFTLTPDYAFGIGAQKEVEAAVASAGGKFLGAARVPSPVDDPSAYILDAQSSGASVVDVLQGGQDLQNVIKTAHEFGLGQTDKQRLAVFILWASDVRALGLEAAQGIRTVNAFYWDQTDATRAWSQRFLEITGHMPEPVQAGMYGAAIHYLEAVKAAGTDDTAAVLARMRQLPVNDFMTQDARIRPDGRLLRDMYIFEVKKASESTGPWDVFKQVARIPADQTARPMGQGGCSPTN